MIVCGLFAVTFYNNLPEIVSPKDVILLFTLTWKSDLKFVYFDLPVVIASSAAPEEKLVTTNVMSIRVGGTG